ncbi:MAG: hypothetical protein AAFW68_06760 [Pseudomonadota bacterium]
MGAGEGPENAGAQPVSAETLLVRFDGLMEALERIEARLEAFQAEQARPSSDTARILLRQQSLAAAIDRIEAALQRT